MGVVVVIVTGMMVLTFGTIMIFSGRSTMKRVMRAVILVVCFGLWGSLALGQAASHQTLPEYLDNQARLQEKREQMRRLDNQVEDARESTRKQWLNSLTREWKNPEGKSLGMMKYMGVVRVKKAVEGTGLEPAVKLERKVDKKVVEVVVRKRELSVEDWKWIQKELARVEKEKRDTVRLQKTLKRVPLVDSQGRRVR